MKRSDLPIRRGTVWQHSRDDETAVYEPDSDGVHLLNPSAMAIWELCDGETRPEEMAAAISELTSIDVADALTDVRNTLETLEGLGLISYRA